MGPPRSQARSSSDHSVQLSLLAYLESRSESWKLTPVFYSGHGRERVQNVLGVGRDLNDTTAAEVRRKLAAKEIDLVLIHVAEGKRTDRDSIKEFDLLKERGFLAHTPAVIHGVAFDKSDFGKMRLAATALVWSPQVT